VGGLFIFCNPVLIIVFGRREVEGFYRFGGEFNQGENFIKKKGIEGKQYHLTGRIIDDYLP